MEYKVLIIEDDVAVAEAASSNLRACGLISKVINRGDLAISTLKEWQPHVVVLDLGLPGQSGLQILQQMFLDPDLRDLIIIANTVHMDAKDDLGFAYYYHYRKIKNEEPVMINKLQSTEDRTVDLPLAIAQMLGQKFGSIPKPLAEYLQKKYPDNPSFDVV